MAPLKKQIHVVAEDTDLGRELVKTCEQRGWVATQFSTGSEAEAAKKIWERDFPGHPLAHIIVLGPRGTPPDDIVAQMAALWDARHRLRPKR